jgi:hypothetical protein
MEGGGLFRAIEAEDAAIGSAGFAFVAALVTGILFIIWFFQAYKAGQSRGATGRTWGSGWTIGAWFIPIANLVIPKLVMNETDRMLDPWAGVPPTETRWKDCGRLLSSDLWWMLVILGTVIGWVGSGIRGAVPVLESGYGTGILISAVGLGVSAAAAAVAGGMVLTIGRRGRGPR